MIKLDNEREGAPYVEITVDALAYIKTTRMRLGLYLGVCVGWLTAAIFVALWMAAARQ